MRQAIEKLKAQLTRAEAKALASEEAYSLDYPLKAMGMAGAAMAYMLVVKELDKILEQPEVDYRTTVDEPDTGEAALFAMELVGEIGRMKVDEEGNIEPQGFRIPFEVRTVPKECK